MAIFSCKTVFYAFLLNFCWCSSNMYSQCHNKKNINFKKQSEKLFLNYITCYSLSESVFTLHKHWKWIPFSFSVRKLLMAGVSPNVTNEDGLTALHQVVHAIMLTSLWNEHNNNTVFIDRKVGFKWFTYLSHISAHKHRIFKNGLRSTHSLCLQ